VHTQGRLRRCWVRTLSVASHDEVGSTDKATLRTRDYSRREDRAHQLDRNWAELVQELRVLGTGIQILFAFLLTIAFQARFEQTTAFEKDVYLATMMASGLAAVFIIAPVALHRFLFQFGVKDEVVTLTNRIAICGLVALSVAMVGAILLVGVWVGGAVFGWMSTGCAAVILGLGWFGGPVFLRHRTQTEAVTGETKRVGVSSTSLPGGQT
jgi:hypothetical protein